MDIENVRALWAYCTLGRSSCGDFLTLDFRLNSSITNVAHTWKSLVFQDQF